MKEMLYEIVEMSDARLSIVNIKKREREIFHSKHHMNNIGTTLHGEIFYTLI